MSKKAKKLHFSTKRFALVALLAALFSGSASVQACGPSPGGQTCNSGTQAASLGNDSSTNQGAGNPINIINGNKYQQEVDLPALPGVLGLEIIRHYNSQYSMPNVPNGAFGRGWKLSYETDLYVSSSTIQIVQADGTRIIFNRDADHPSLCSSLNPANGKLAIEKKSSGDEYTWTWPNGRQLNFNSDGKLVQIAAPTGEFVSLTRDAKGMLLKVTDPQGRSLHLNYLDKQSASQGDRFRGVQSIDSPVGRFGYSYGSAAPPGSTLDKNLLLANLVKVAIPTSYDAGQKAHAYTERGTSSSSVSRLYHYEDPHFPTLLTGITVNGSGSDGKQLNQRLSTWIYDQNGRGILSTKGSPARLQTDKDGKPLEPKRLAPGTGLEQVIFDRKQANKVILTNSLGQTTSYSYAIIGGEYRLLEVRGPGCASCGPSNVRYGYDAVGRLTETTQLNDGGQAITTSKTDFDSYGRIVRTSRVGYANGKSQSAQWLTRYEYPALDKNNPAALPSMTPIVIARPSVIAGKEVITRFTYNDAGQVAKVSESGFAPAIDDKDVATAIERSTSYGYSKINGRSLLSRIDGPLANGPKSDPSDSDVTEIAYDNRGSFVTAVTYPLNLSRHFTRDEGTGRLAQDIANDGIVTNLAYNTLGMVTRTERAGLVTERKYNALDQVSALSDAAGRGISLRYDSAGRPVHMEDAQGYFSELSLDTEGQLKVSGLYEPAAEQSQGKLVRATYRSYDENNRLARQLLPDGRIDTYAYDAQGRLARHLDGDDVLHLSAENKSSTARANIDLAADGMLRVDFQLAPAASDETASKIRQNLVRDDFGRVLKMHLPDYGNKTSRYDMRDRMIRLDQADGSSIAFSYDLAGRMIQKTTTSAGAAKVSTVSLRYQGNRLMEVTDPVQTTAYAYDAAGRIAQTRITIDRQSYTLATTYDPRTGEPSTQRLADGQVMRIERDKATQVARSISLQGERSAGMAAQIEKLPSWLQWAKAVLPKQAVVAEIGFSPYNGLTGYTQGNGIKTAKGFDIAGRLTSLKIGDGRNSIASWSYDYGVGPRIRALQAAAGTQTNASGNIVKASYDYSGFGALKPAAPLFHLQKTAVSADSMARSIRNQRDALGRSVDDGQYRYSYTPEGQIETVTDAKSGAPVATYRYNSFNQRIVKTVYGKGQEAAVTTHYLWQQNRLVAETDQQGRISAQYLYLSEDGKAAPVAKLESEAGKSNRLLYIHADQRGAPIAMTDGDQHVVWQADVAPWGQAKIQSKDGSTLNLRLPGQYYDAETSLHDNFHRTYNPATGRYLQPDPLGYLDGPDPYSYVQGDPINKIDPLGLYQSDIHYYMTYFLAIAAGIDKEDARTIALAAQFVDDNPLTEPIDLDETGSPEYIKSIFDNQPRLKNYHFTLSDGTTGTTAEKYKNNNLDLALTDPSQQLLNLLRAAENAPSKCPSLQFFGEYLHAFQDTFSHRDSNDIPVDAVWHVPLSDTQLGIGHGYLFTNPDMTYNHFGWNTNEARTLEMEKDVYTQMINMKGQLGLSTPEKSFDDLVPLLKQFNAVKADESTKGKEASTDLEHPNFASKIDALQASLMLLGFDDINMRPKGEQGYDEVEAAKNRKKNLAGLDQKNYPGTCITSCLKAN
ncbi:DUF6765 family protein [Collimonas sp. PA-H2]|uniref:DUF6765 family protein n=1 Tax=Collimonas sp. PA-H2 TaxID=1881062 RepID=UPI0013040E5C|nr:DUF6765 family protein [Collimonas sp. PA-H2]